MTEQEYIEIMDNSNFLIDSANPYDMEIKKALEKQIPKKPKKLISYDMDIGFEVIHTQRGFCSSCGQSVIEEKHDFCPKCGQAIKWIRIFKEKNMSDIKHIGNITIYPKDCAMHGAWDIRLRKGYLCVRFPQKNYPFYVYYSENGTPSKAKWIIGEP